MLQTTAWKDFRPFTVFKKVAESCSVKSFYLRPKGGGELPTFRPGQYVNIKLNIPDQLIPTLRSYTLSNNPTNTDYYRLSIKRELPPVEAPGAPPGSSSNFMHDHVKEGSEVLLSAPTGQFVLRPEGKGPVVFLAGGIGCTPLISMLTAVADTKSTRKAWFIHGDRNSSEIAFSNQLVKLAAEHKNIHVHIRYSRPEASCRFGHDYQSAGHVDMRLIRTLIPGPEPQFFLCGSLPFMRSLYQGLIKWGVDPFQINYEFFGQATNLLEENSTSQTTIENTVEHFEVVFQRSGVTANWSTTTGSILDLAEANHIKPDFICRSGTCQTCLSRVVHGTFAYFNESVIPPDGPNDILICSAHPTSDIVLDI